MKFSLNNPFTAPDIKDVIQERNLSFRTLALVLGSGIVLSSTLIGGYHIGQWFIGSSAPAAFEIPQTVMPVSTLSTEEQRLAELGGIGEQTPYDVMEATRRINELERGAVGSANASVSSASNTAIMEERLKELGG
jgi:hypothetical protein